MNATSHKEFLRQRITKKETEKFRVKINRNGLVNNKEHLKINKMRILIRLFISAVRIKFQIFYLNRELNNLFKYKTKMFYIISYEKFEICSQKSEKKNMSKYRMNKI